MSIENSISPNLSAFKCAADHALTADRKLSVEGGKVEASDRSLAGKRLAMLRGFPEELKQSAATFEAFKNALAESYGEKIATATVNEMQRQTGGVFVAKHVKQGLSLADGIVKRLREETPEPPKPLAQATATASASTTIESSVSMARTQSAQAQYERAHFQSSANFASLIRPNIDETPGIGEQSIVSVRDQIKELLKGRAPEELTVAEKTRFFELEAQLQEKASNR